MKDKIKNFINSLKQNGWKTEFRRIINYIRYHKTVPEPYEEWKILNEPSEAEIEQQKSYESCLQTKFLIIVPDEKLADDLKKQTYSKFNIKIENKPNEYQEIIKSEEFDYVIFLDKNIYLYPFALFDIVKYLEYNDCYIFYADNDFCEINDAKVIRKNPKFKPDFAYDTLLSKNYIGNFIGVKKEFLQKNIEILNNLNMQEPFYDILLKAVEKIENYDKILHIDKIIYGKGSNEINNDAKKSIIEEHLKRKNVKYDAVENGKYEGQHHVKYNINGNPKVSIVIPNMDHIEDLKVTIQSILEKSTYTNIEIVIVENNSKREETFNYYDELVKEHENIRVEKLEINYFNYSKIVNFGVEKSTGEYVILLNNDVEIITPNWIEEMLMYVMQPRIGICGAKLYFPDKTIQHAGVTIGIRGLAGHRYREVSEKDFSENDDISFVQNLSAVTAACFMVSKSNYEKVLGFDEKLAVAFNDVDFCLKIKEENLQIIYNPFVELYHYESKSRGQDDSGEKQKRFAREYELFVKRWNKQIQQGDMYYNINYRLDTDIPTINYNKIR